MNHVLLEPRWNSFLIVEALIQSDSNENQLKHPKHLYT